MALRIASLRLRVEAGNRPQIRFMYYVIVPDEVRMCWRIIIVTDMHEIDSFFHDFIFFPVFLSVF